MKFTDKALSIGAAEKFFRAVKKMSVESIIFFVL